LVFIDEKNLASEIFENDGTELRLAVEQGLGASE